MKTAKLRTPAGVSFWGQRCSEGHAQGVSLSGHSPQASREGTQEGSRPLVPRAPVAHTSNASRSIFSDRDLEAGSNGTQANFNPVSGLFPFFSPGNHQLGTLSLTQALEAPGA